MEARVAKDDHADGLLEVFAFGSNLDLTDFIAWCRRERGMTPQIERRSWAWLRDYRFSWDYYSPVRRGGAANITPAAGSLGSWRGVQRRYCYPCRAGC